MKQLVIVFFGMIMIIGSSVNAEQNSQTQFIQNKISEVDTQIEKEQVTLNDLRKELAQKKSTLAATRSEIVDLEKELEKTSNELSASLLALSDTAKKNQDIKDQLPAGSSPSQLVSDSDTAFIVEEDEAHEVKMQEPAESNLVLEVDQPSVTVYPASEEAIVEPELIESNDQVTQDDAEDISDEQVDDEDNVVVDSVKAGGEFVKDETTSVIKNEAKSTVREGIRSALGL